MRAWGIVLIVIAVASWFLPRFGLQILVLAWIDQWGTRTGLLIRAGFVALGLAMVGMSLASKRRGGGPPPPTGT